MEQDPSSKRPSSSTVPPRPISASASSGPTTPSRRNSHYAFQRGSLAAAPTATSPPAWQQQSNNGQWVGSHFISGEDSDEDPTPENYGNLTEINAPSPVKDPHEERRRSHLEDKRHSETRDLRRKSQRTIAESLKHGELGISPLASPVPRRAEVARPMRASMVQVEAEEQPERTRGPLRPWVTPSPDGPGVSRVATEIYTLSYLVVFSILGTLARLGVQWLNFYPGAPILPSVLWANFGGSLFMGFLSEDRMLFAQEWGRTKRDYRDETMNEDNAYFEAAKQAHANAKKTIPLYIGLATGFCGSFTSFSSFMRDVFLALSNNLPAALYHPQAIGYTVSSNDTIHRNSGFSFEALLAVIVTTVALSLSALHVGAHIAIYLQPYLPSLPYRTCRTFLDPLVVFLSWGCWLGAVFMAIWPPDRPGGPSSRGSWANETWRGQAIFACVFAPVGCLLRFYTSLKLNGLVASFPLGTFAVNMLGTAVLGMAFDLQHVPLKSAGGSIGGGRVRCQILQGIDDGFCGCLTTVSTWVAELNGLRRGHAYYYGISSIVMALGLLVIIMGSIRWTIGWQDPVCIIPPS
ncbi:MAG: hypothetical protein M1820_003219 [Bogoriella megaspora]|nr:MAG: hypothetical protein M1820_003219 [Bogoriella megaspora]